MKMKVQQTMMMRPRGKSAIATSAVGQAKMQKKTKTTSNKKSVPMNKKGMKKKMK